MLVKICGIKNTSALQCCNMNNVNFFGMIFYKKSPRNINLDQANNLQNYSKKLGMNGVGVFVNEEIANLKTIISKLSLKYVQLHGDEDYEYINIIKKLDVKIIKKISIEQRSDLDSLKKFYNTDYFLFDYKPKNNELPGGNNKKFDWQIIRNLKIDKPWFLSGGVNVNNISLIKNKIRPFGIDLSSGLEKELGIKDNQTINNFMEELKNA